MTKLRVVAAVAAVLCNAVPAHAGAQESLRERIPGCYALTVVEGPEGTHHFTRPPGLFRLDLLHDFRTGAAYTYVAVAQGHSALTLQMERFWTITASDSVEVSWASTGFWGVWIRFPVAGHAVEGYGVSWSDADIERRFRVRVAPADCGEAQWVQTWPVSVTPWSERGPLAAPDNDGGSQ